MGTNTLFWNDKKGMTKLESFVVIPKLWSGYILWGAQATTYITSSHIPHHRVTRKMDIFLSSKPNPSQKSNIITPVQDVARLLQASLESWNRHPRNASQTSNCLLNKLTNHALILTDHFPLNWRGGWDGYKCRFTIKRLEIPAVSAQAARTLLYCCSHQVCGLELSNNYVATLVLYFTRFHD